MNSSSAWVSSSVCTPCTAKSSGFSECKEAARASLVSCSAEVSDSGSGSSDRSCKKDPMATGVQGEVEAGLAPRVDEVGRTLGGWGCGGTGGWARVLSSAGSEGGVVGGGGVLCIVLPGELQALPPAGMPVGSAFGGRGGAALRGRGNP
eukprot:3546065-Pyramimonas_sp.AAC.2